MSNAPTVTVVIPFYQQKKGLLNETIQSIYDQTFEGEILVIIVDDGSPISAEEELSDITFVTNRKTKIFTQKNGGAGSARNNALNNVPQSTDYVAFIDSDDQWHEKHLENAIRALQLGYQAYFSDHHAALYPSDSNFERIGTLPLSEHTLLDKEHNIFEMGISALEHIVADGGGVIGTSNVVYNFQSFENLRFREQFYNGQDFFFWMDLSNLGAKWVFSTNIECNCGTGINIYSGSGWGTEKSLQRLRNELFIWTSVEKFYSLSHESYQANKNTIKNLQINTVRDIFHRIIHRKPISFSLIKDIIKMAPSTPLYFLIVPLKVIKERLNKK